LAKFYSQLQLSRANLLRLILATLGAAVALAELYTFVGQWFQSPWLGAALVNTIVAAIVIAFRRKIPIPTAYHPGAPNLAYAPAGVVLIVIAVAGAVSRSFGGANAQGVELTQWAWILWVPVVEEIVFRWGAGSLLKKMSNPLWGSYFSVLLFTFLHSNPTLQNLASLQVGFALGPLLLSMCCELILVYFGRISAAILFHMVCNFSVVMFSVLDSRWLKWLDFLYM
jgi:membrane protease YdiL (CAAX protease family)